MGEEAIPNLEKGLLGGESVVCLSGDEKLHWSSPRFVHAFPCLKYISD